MENVKVANCQFIFGDPHVVAGSNEVYLILFGDSVEDLIKVDFCASGVGAENASPVEQCYSQRFLPHVF
jgi:hypothetical protein